MTFGEWLKWEIDASKLTTVDVAELASCSPEMVRALLRGARLPSFDMAIKLCTALNAELEDASYCDEFLTADRPIKYYQTKERKANGHVKQNQVRKSPSRHKGSKRVRTASKA